eukprot:Platyproteum_vivax@DN12749_c0_g1_i1.p1
MPWPIGSLHQCDKACQIIRHNYAMPWPIGSLHQCDKACQIIRHNYAMPWPIGSLHQCDKACQIIRHNYAMPWPIGSREVVMKAFGVDCLDDPLGSILLICTSPEGEETNAFDYEVAPSEKGEKGSRSTT